MADKHPHEPEQPDGEPDLAHPVDEPLRDDLQPAEEAPDPGDVEDWSP